MNLSNIDNYIILILVTVFTIVLTYILVDLIYANKSTDQWVTKWFIKNYKSGFFGYKYEKSIVLGKLSGPRWYYSALGYCFKFKDIDNIGKLLNILFHLLTYFLLAVVLILECKIDIINSILIASTFSLSPILFPRTARFNSIKSRSFGKFLTFLIILCLYYNNYTLLLPITVLAFILIGSSSMGTQYVLVVLLYFSVIKLHLMSIISLIIISTLIYIFGFGLKDVVKQKIYHIKWYNKILDKVYLASQKNIILDLLFWKKNRFEHNIILLTLKGCPVLLILPFINFEFTSGNTEFLIFSTNIVMCTLGLIILTGIKPLTIFGQAERYLEYAIPYVAIIFSNFGFNSYISLIILMNISFILYSVKKSIIIMNSDEKNLIEEEAIEVLNKLKNNQEIEIKIITFPFKYAFKVDTLLSGNYKIYLEWFHEKVALNT